MTDRVHALTVVLERDIRDDDIQPLVDAIRQFRFVIDVQPHISEPSLHTAEMRAKVQLRQKLFEVLE